MSVHWLRVTHPLSERLRLRQVLVERFGEPDVVLGRWFFEHGEKFGNGVLLLWGNRVKGDGDECCCIDVPGGALDAMEADERYSLCVMLSLGGRVTRVDLALDCKHRQGVGLIECIINSCRRGELCGARRWEPRQSFVGDEVDAYGVTIGKRGNAGSGRYVRCYDKGLETGEHDQGQWERFEVEFSDDAASEVCADVFGGCRDWEKRAYRRIVGAVSFRERGSDGDRHLDRRDLVEWWAQFIDGHTPEPTVVKRTPTTLYQYAQWLSRTVLPTIVRLADAARVPFTDALVHLVGHEVKPRTTDKYMRAMLVEWAGIRKDRPVIAAT